jgi:hypothetical protein
VLSNLCTTTGYADAPFLTLLSYAAPLVVVEIFQRLSGQLEFLTVGPFIVRYTLAVGLLLTLLAFSAHGSHEFIYFDF